MNLGYLGIGLVLLLGISVVAYGWLSDRAQHRHTVQALNSPPDHPVPGLRTDAPAPAYFTHPDPRTSASNPLPAEHLDAINSQLDTATPLPFGHATSLFATQEDGRAILKAPLILLCEEPLTNVRELLPAAGRANRLSRPLVVAAPAIDADVLGTLEANAHHQVLPTLALILPTADDRALLSTATGATPIPSADLRADYLPAEALGSCATWVSTTAQSWALATDPSTTALGDFSASGTAEDATQA